MNPEYPIFSTTLCYLERDDAYLMLHRVKKEDDYNHDKWVGVGGKFERFESPEDCLLREVKEETGLTLTHWRSRGLLTFIWGNMTEFIHLYTADGWTGEMIQGDACREGVLEWVPKERVEQLPIWEGDKIFFKLLNEEHPWSSIKLVYEANTRQVLGAQAWGEKNVSARINAIAVAIRAGMTVEALGQVDFVYSSSSCSIWDPVQIVCGQAQ